MGGKSGGGTQTTKVELPDYARPYAEQLMQRSADLSNQEVPQYGGQLTAGLNGDHQAAIDAIRQRATAGSPLVNAARGSLTNIASGNAGYQSAANPYMGDNPYLDASINKTLGDMATNYATGTGAQTMAQFRNAGAFGGSAQAETQALQNKTLADAMANASNSARMANYQQSAQLAENALNRDASNYWQGQANQLNAAQLAPMLASQDYRDAQALLGIGDIQRENDQSQLNDAYTRWQNMVNAPYQQLETLSNGIMGATGGGMARNTTAANPYQPNRTAGAIGGAMSGAALGSMVMPGIGTAVGAGLGLLGGMF
ncbi:conserved hypothetical protein [Cupriavidus taiwanensis]|uniref:hypothetical protein n=1 Tax=Cupriavidus taiwanensis TaxID=164546 RepID=UPI000E134C48|nr:hypothetical protein [Cupriavidus taiwanensis]SPA24583.1 conserved hypothetical protein [Cupriavidus taiwanensis]